MAEYASYDSMAERAAIMARLGTLAGGRVGKAHPDAKKIERDEDGNALPYLVVRFGNPVPSARDRGLGGETTQPHAFPWTVSACGGVLDDVEELSAAVRRKMLGWIPNPPNTGQTKGGSGYSYSALDSEKRPARFEEGTYWTCAMNLDADWA